jgi:hypothetical protein
MNKFIFILFASLAFVGPIVSDNCHNIKYIIVMSLATIGTIKLVGD